MKTCIKCNQIKEESEFCYNKSQKYRLHNWCNVCIATEVKIYNLRSAVKRKALREAAEKAHRSNEKRKAARKKYNSSDEAKAILKKKNLKSQLKCKYNITIQDYNKMLAEQNECCAICGIHPHKVLNVDHDHITGKVRGLLCTKCNIMLGNAKDSREVLLKAVSYLENILEQEYII